MSRVVHTPKRAIALLMVSALVLTTVLTVASTAGARQTAGKKICVAMKTQLQRRWTFDFKAMQAQATKLGDTVSVQWANDDPAKQASQVESLLVKGCDAMIIVPVDDKAAASLVKKAKTQGVPVISYDIMIQSRDLAFFVERNNGLVGTLQAKAALKFAGGKGNFAVIKGDPANSVARDISDAVAKQLAGRSGIKVVYNQFTKNWDPKTALSVAEDVLSRYDDDIKAFITSNDGMATGVVQALKGRQLTGKVFVSGLDADPANLQLIAQGAQTMSVWTPIDQQARIAMSAAHELANGRKPAAQAKIKGVPTAFVKVIEVNKSNLCAYIKGIAPKGWVKVTDVFPGKPKACG
ncbi:MAG: substrate-binding domain-containing protein [Gaiellales bacterium]